MPYSRDGEKITLTMTSDEYSQLLFMLGVSACESNKPGDRTIFYRYNAFMNHLNAGNPDFTPYEIPEEYREESNDGSRKTNRGYRTEGRSK